MVEISPVQQTNSIVVVYFWPKMAPISLFLVCVLWAIVGRAFSQTELSEADKQVLLDTHNRLRESVDPPATNMQTMVWNDDLAQVAQSYAEQCIFEHNDDRVSSQSTFTSVGENLLVTTASVADYESFVESWYNEREDYDYNSGQCAAGKVCGHYTQVVWATSNNLGCGVYRCSSVVSFSGSNALLLVCNYGPAGNLIGAKPYESDSTGTDIGLRPAASIVLLSSLIAAATCIITT